MKALNHMGIEIKLIYSPGAGGYYWKILDNCKISQIFKAKKQALRFQKLDKLIFG